MNPRQILRIIASIAVGVIGMACVTVSFWLGGFNFDTRGNTAVVCFLGSLVVGGLSFMLGMLLTSGE